ncbi:F/Y rich C-terminus-domain-containing protein [Mycena galopus ATCC 62051]|nr:F/Y rich C-terminus-domain-containing protein [Mycena galopus ATCC 62051]
MSAQDQGPHDPSTMPPQIEPAFSAHFGEPSSPKAKDTEEIHEKYRELKRRFFELQEKHKETSGELQRSGESDATMREERNVLLDRIIELESLPGFQVAPADALPRIYLDSRTRVQDGDADAEIDPALLAHDATRHASNTPDANNGEEPAPVMVSSTGTRLRIRAAGGADQDTSLDSPDSSGIPADDENDDSGDYSPPQKGAKRNRDDADYTDTLVAVAPEPKAPRRSSRRAAPAAAANPPSTSRGSRVIQKARTSTGKAPNPPAPESAPEQAAPSPDSGFPATQTNGHPETTPTASSSSASSAPRPGNLAFNPYLGYLTTNAAMPAAYNPYMMYMPMPGTMPYMPPPTFAPPPPQQQQQERAPAAEAPRAAKPKRLKAHTVTSKSYSIPMVPRDKKGKPMLPLNVGIMTVINLGDVCMREHFHTERYIYPVGYEVTRRYLSTIDQSAEVVYHCTILDGGDGPKFQIIPSDVPDRPVIAGTATGAWSSIVKQANAIRQRQHSNSVSGPDFFGLGQNTIKHLIQELPNADRLRDYVWQHFVEGGPLGGRHAAVIPALPEEYDAAMPIGPYYPPRPQIQREQQEGPRVSHYPPHIYQQQYGGAGRDRQQVMPGHAHADAGASNGNDDGAGYALSHTQQGPGGELEDGPGYAPAPPNGSAGPTYASASASNGNGSSFASIMNAFPTQEGHGHGHENGGDGIAS